MLCKYPHLQVTGSGVLWTSVFIYIKVLSPGGLACVVNILSRGNDCTLQSLANPTQPRWCQDSNKGRNTEMARLRLLGPVAFLLLQVARCDNLLVSRDQPLVPGEVAPIADIEYKPELGSMPLSGRELVSEWTNTGGLSKRACVDAGYVPCSSEFNNVSNHCG